MMLRTAAARQLLGAARRGLVTRAPVLKAASATPDSVTEASDYHSKPIPVEARGGLLEYSVIYTDRAVNSMSTTFQKVMKDLHGSLTRVYNAERAVIMPGSGSYAMEAVARQFCLNKKALVIRNGYFSYRWTDIFEQTSIPSETIVMKARPVDDSAQPAYAPPPIEEVVAKIAAEKPAVVFAPHVETSTGIMLPDSYVKALADAAHAAGGHFVLDGVASGMKWVDMEGLGIDAYITAPQKGWTGPACAGLVILSKKGNELVSNTTSDSMVLNLQKWRDVMDTYLNGAFSYYTTMPTDALQLFRDVAAETESYGFKRAEDGFCNLGKDIRARLVARGFKSVAAEGFEAPGVVVSYTADEAMVKKFIGQGIQVAAGVPFMLDETTGPATKFRIGLFGIDKIYDHDTTVSRLEAALDNIAKGN